MHAYRAIEDSPRLYEWWLHVLSKHVVSVEVSDKVRQLLMAPQVSGQATCFAEGIGLNELDMEKPVGVVIGAKRPRPLNVFTEKHIPILVEKLTACAGKWLEISILLGLPGHVRKDLLIMSSTARFSWLLWEWIVGKHSGAEDPTLENLEKVLRSQTV